MKSGNRLRQRPLSNKAKLISLTAGSLLLWQVISLSLAAGHGDYESDLSAADYASTSAAAATTAAAQRLQDGDPNGARVFAKQALSISPLSAASVRSLGFAEQALGHWQHANAILSQSAALGWRDVATQLWLMQAYLQQKDYPQAAERLDAALRTDPDQKALYNILDHLVADNEFAAAVAKRLTLDPNWRTPYLRYVSGITVDALRARSRVLSALAQSATPPSREEILPIISALVQAKQIPQAHELWLGLQRDGANSSYNSGFEHSGTTGMSPFEWTLLPVLGANVSTDTASGKAVLHASTDGSTSGILARQLIVLSPGWHVLSYVGSTAPADHAAFGWSVRCTDTSKMLLNMQSSDALPPYRFDVPSECGSQYLELRVRVSPAAANKPAEFSRVRLD
jgi:hypothetical protein